MEFRLQPGFSYPQAKTRPKPELHAALEAELTRL